MAAQIRVSQSYSEAEITVLVEIFRVIQQAGSQYPMTRRPEFRDLAGKVVRMRKRLDVLKAAKADDDSSE